jgi:hypothetical protein
LGRARRPDPPSFGLGPPAKPIWANHQSAMDTGPPLVPLACAPGQPRAMPYKGRAAEPPACPSSPPRASTCPVSPPSHTRRSRKLAVGRPRFVVVEPDRRKTSTARSTATPSRISSVNPRRQPITGAPPCRETLPPPPLDRGRG